MCGIAGFYNLGGEAANPELLKRMSDRIAHRGPDGEGQFVEGPLALGHRRLAIIDLSPTGRQPMANESGSVVITYNGEIYNYRELRAELDGLGYHFHSKSDTEVLIHAYEEWGEKCIERLNGMFAFALYDRGEGNNKSGKAGRLFLARDRYGVKPLYYYHGKDVFLFASEIKALIEHPALNVRLCYPALSEYFTFQNTLSDLTLFEGVRMLPAGCTMTVRPTEHANGFCQNRYWDYSFQSNDLDLSQDDCAEELHRLFDQAVTRQLVADVPVGSYLSGGMDSGSITAVAARHIPRIHTFSGGFDLSSASGLELNFDERPAAEFMANLFKTEHYEIVMHAGDMEHVLHDLIWHLEDLRVGQCYPNYYTARLASKFVKVVLSGGGGDELFAGYPWRYYGGARTRNADEYYRAYYNFWQRLIPDDHRPRFFQQDVFSRIKDVHPFEAFKGVFTAANLQLETVEDKINASLYFELKTFLHGLFVVEDKVSMAHSLETRVPFMDNDLVDFAGKIPPRYKLRDLLHPPKVDEDEPAKRMRYQAEPQSDGKQILRQAMGRLIPGDITARAKQGFSAPDASWFRGESINYVNDLLRNPKAEITQLISSSYVAQTLEEHSSGQVNHRLLIWSLLCLEWWLRIFKPSL